MNNRPLDHAARGRITLWLLLFVSWSLVFPMAARGIEVKEPITVNGDMVEYFQDKKIVTGTKNVVITYKDIVLTCDQITVNLDTQEALAEGNVRITQKDAYFTGDRISYNFRTRTGRVIDGFVDSKPFYGKAPTVDKVSESQVSLSKGYVTTCDLEKPHYRVRAREVQIYIDDKVIAKDIVLYLGDIPVLFWPYYVQPLKEETAHFTAIAGKESDWGYYALTSLAYRFSEIANGRVRLDYRSKKGLAEGLDNYYATKELGHGYVKFYYIKENDGLTYAPSGPEKTRWRTQVRHKWDMKHDTVATVEFNYLSDQDFIKDYLYNEYKEAFIPDNYISFLTTKRDYAVNLLFRKRMDHFTTVVERLPEFSIDFRSYKLGKTSFYYQGNTSAVYLNRTIAKQDPPVKDVGVTRVDTYNQLSYAGKVGPVSLMPYAGMRQTYYSRNAWGDTNLIRGIFQAGLNGSTKFYRVYNAEANLLGMEIHKLRHIVTPTFNYYYLHQPTIAPENLNQFDEIDAFDTQNGVKLAIENRIQTKRHIGEDGSLKSVDLATFIVGTDFQWRFKKDVFSMKNPGFKGVDFQLELRPYPWAYSLSKMTVNTKNQAVQTASMDMTLSPAEEKSLGFGYRYETTPTGKANLATYEAMYRITPMWKARAYGRYDVIKGAYEEQEYTIYRDLHCWIAEFTVNVKNEEKNSTFWLVMRLKAFPDMPIGLRQSYSRSGAGASQ